MTDEDDMDLWLQDFTWIQADGSMDFGNPRVRPPNLAVDSRELGAPEGVLLVSDD